MQASKLKCILCKTYPNGDVYECDNHHVGCISCVDMKISRMCLCDRPFSGKKQNPIEQLEKQIKLPCDFKESGCTWLFGALQLKNHLKECKFRPYRCIIDKLDVKPCSWTGPQYEVDEHLEDDHPELGTAFSYFQESAKLPFTENETKAVVKLVDAFSKNFLFYYRLNAEARMAYFMIIYFGRRVEAQQYYYELDIRSSEKHDVSRVKFTQSCVADCEDFEQLIQQERHCIAMTYKSLKHYLSNGNTISFRFIVKKVEKDADRATTRERKVSHRERHHSPSKEDNGRTRYTSGSSQDDPPLRTESNAFGFPVF